MNELKETQKIEHQYLKVAEVAKLLRLASQTVLNMLNSGEMPGYKIGGRWRVSTSDLDSYVKGTANR